MAVARAPPQLRSGRSARAFARAQRILVGGVDSPVRAFRDVGGTPLFIARGRGPWIEDIDGNRFVDYVMSWGALILGHAPPEVVAVVQGAAERGTSFGAATEAEVELGEAIRRAMPSVERIRFVSSGTEATMSAIRAARGFTKRTKLVKFEGCYHGHADGLLVRAGSGMAAAGLPKSAGVPGSIARSTIVARYNDLDDVVRAFERHGKDVAAVIVEPVAGNMGVVPPAKGFLEGLRALTRDHGSLLIFDEVITGFRVGRGGAQRRYGVTPDLTCLGKVIGGGLPAAAYGGREDVMSVVAPLGPVYQAGTLAGNPLAMAAGLATLRQLRESTYARLEGTSRRFEAGIRRAATAAGVVVETNRVGSMVGLFFHEGPVTNYADVQASKREAYVRLFWSLLRRGVYVAPAAFESIFPSTAHDSAALDLTQRAMDEAFSERGP